MGNNVQLTINQSINQSKHICIVPYVANESEATLCNQAHLTDLRAQSQILVFFTIPVKQSQLLVGCHIPCWDYTDPVVSAKMNSPLKLFIQDAVHSHRYNVPAKYCDFRDCRSTTGNVKKLKECCNIIFAQQNDSRLITAL